MSCQAIKTSGEMCGKRCPAHNPRCSTHMKTIQTNGPHGTARKELSYSHRAITKQTVQAEMALITQEPDALVKRRMNDDLIHRLNLLKLDQNREMNLLVRQQEDEVRRTGVDPDRVAKERREAELQRRQEMHRAHWAQFNAQREFRNEQAALLAAAARAQAAVQPQRELENFVNDNQNVHLTKTVEMVKKMVEKILKVPVPEEYRWNMTKCSKTPGEIIMTCELTPKAAWQMSAKYCQDETIYEMGNGIYGKVLDSVWQYILASPDKVDLCRCLKQEMEDNIGMCAQGNLSRLCNILVGYMDGVEPKESVADILGRLLPKLMDIECLRERLNQAFQILKENDVNVAEWRDWIDPLLLDQDVDMEVKFIRNASDEVTGFVAVSY